VPIEGVPTGPRAIRWIPTLPHTLLWVEALDGGDPKRRAEHRDKVVTWAMSGPIFPVDLMKLEHRFAGINFFPSDNRMLISDYDRERKWSRSFVASTTPYLGGESKLLFDRSAQDRYGDPGTPLTRSLPSGHRVLRTADVAGDAIWLSGSGASPKGDRPFLDKYNVKTEKSERVFQCDEGVYEDVVAVLNSVGTKLLVRRESPTEPPNFYYRDANHQKKLTDNPDPPAPRAAEGQERTL